MSSIMTNASAMAALQTMRSINDQMETTQNRISSGYRVDTASDNAAYWSIATTMRSDNAAMSTVSDALGLGSAQVDVAYTAMESVRDTLDEIKTKLVAAQQPDVDKSKIQSEIKQLQADLKTFAESATFSGGNWLDVSETGVEKIVASFIRDESGSISLGTIDVDTSDTALFTADGSGILETGVQVAKTLDAAVVTGTAVPGDATAPTSASQTIAGLATADAFAEGDTLSFDVAVNDGEATTVTVTAGEDGAFTAAAFNDALAAAGVTGLTAAYDASTGAGTVTFTKDGTPVDGDGVAITNLSGTEESETINVSNFDISEATADQLNSFLSSVEEALGSVTSAAADLGAVKTRVGSQQDFVSKLMDAVDRGVGQLVDADMNEESTRLKALQTQQQLGIQALSIANSNSQNILSLFRG